MNLNWGRTLHWFTLNTALAGAAIALFHVASGRLTYVLVALIFVCGAYTCYVAFRGVREQHEYYREARDHMRVVEEALGVDASLRLTTTPGMGSQRPRRVRVRDLYLRLFVLLAILDLAGAGFAAYKADRQEPHHPPHVKKRPANYH